jgi:hypothetical protein
MQRGRRLLRYYKGSFTNALKQVYPELVFDISKFSFSGKLRHPRDFFDEFAASRNFDPLDAEQWYPVKAKEVLSEPVCFVLPFPMKNEIADCCKGRT